MVPSKGTENGRVRLPDTPLPAPAPRLPPRFGYARTLEVHEASKRLRRYERHARGGTTEAPPCRSLLVGDCRKAEKAEFHPPVRVWAFLVPPEPDGATSPPSSLPALGGLPGAQLGPPRAGRRVPPAYVKHPQRPDPLGGHDGTVRLATEAPPPDGTTLLRRKGQGCRPAVDVWNERWRNDDEDGVEDDLKNDV
ncbi:hypothetical protein HPB47_024097 [Ixodes persulcatus]|uniref:Uncharacterized protein n=1 Tax=Ixodes persulcatus TaxID=34615 RepID=A0AC60Q565_IXOPE|nr:hypothetical protein HPB47_024097 [Ixodes persulcatus]